MSDDLASDIRRSRDTRFHTISIQVVRKNGLVIILFFAGFLLLISVLSVLKPNLFVRRRSGLGYSINLRNPWSWTVPTICLALSSVPVTKPTSAFGIRFNPGGN